MLESIKTRADARLFIKKGLFFVKFRFFTLSAS